MVGLFDYPLWVQYAKKSFTNDVVKDPVVHGACVKFLDAQQDFYKVLVDNTTSLTKHYVETQTKFWFPTGEK